MNNFLDAEYVFGTHFNGLHHDEVTPERIKKYAIKFAQLHVAEALTQASENAETEEYIIPGVFYVNKESILNAYPLDLIK